MNIGYIYCIENKLNHKKYIGQTRTPLEVRWNKHKRKASLGEKGIAGALAKYGIENFNFYKILECDVDDLDEMEKYYIKKYDTFNSGYNLTLGGQGSQIYDFDEQEVINKYNELHYINEVAKYYNCCEKTISNILYKNNIKIKRINKETQKQNKFPIRNKSVKIVELDKDFPSLADCAKFLYDEGYAKISNIDYIRKSISRVLRNERKTYLKFHFEYI